MNWINKRKAAAVAALTLVLGVPTIAQAGPDIDIDVIFSNAANGRWMTPGRVHHPVHYRHPGRALGHYKHKRRYVAPRYYNQWRNGSSIQLRLGDFSITHRDYDRRHRDRYDRERYDRERDRRERYRERRRWR